MGFGLKFSMLFLSLWTALCLCACQIEKPEAVEGPAATVRDKDLAVIEGFGVRDYRSSKPGEWVLTEITQSAFGGSLLVTGYILRQMRTIQKIEKVWKFKIMTNDIVVHSDQTTSQNPYMDEIVAEEEADPEPAPTATAVPLSPLEDRKLQEMVQQFQPRSTLSPKSGGGSGFAPCLPVSSGMVKELSPGYFVTYHSLTINTLNQDPPRLIQQASQCQGLANCKMAVRKIVYDEVLRHEMGGTERYRCEYEFSDDIPYLGQMSKRCIHFIAKVDKKDIPIEVCLSLANFEKGSDTVTNPAPPPPPTP
jgi:hypothetical protein